MSTFLRCTDGTNSAMWAPEKPKGFSLFGILHRHTNHSSYLSYLHCANDNFDARNFLCIYTQSTDFGEIILINLASGLVRIYGDYFQVIWYLKLWQLDAKDTRNPNELKWFQNWVSENCLQTEKNGFAFNNTKLSNCYASYCKWFEHKTVAFRCEFSLQHRNTLKMSRITDTFKMYKNENLCWNNILRML